MMSKAQFQQLAEMHADNARQLYRLGGYTNAFHLAGLAVECALKALVCDRFIQGVLPDPRIVTAAHSHKLEDLAGLAGIKAALIERVKADEAFAAKWTAVRNWSIASRYETITFVDAAELIEAALDAGGLLEWIRTYW